MSRRIFRWRLLAAGAVALATTSAITIINTADSPALASFGGDGTGVLTSSQGSNLFVEGGATLYYPGAIEAASWSPDGSRAVFLSGYSVYTLRFDHTGNPTHVQQILQTDGTAWRGLPSWRGDGWGVVWAEQGSGPSRLMTVNSSPYCCLNIDGPDLLPSLPYQLSPDDGYDYTYPDGAANGMVVYQRNTPTMDGPFEVWVYDPTAVPAHRLVITDARSPSISPDGTKVAFLRQTNEFMQVLVSDIDGGNVHAVSPNDKIYGDPTWSPDGQTIAFTERNRDAVLTAPADGSGANSSPTVVPGLNGVPAYQPRLKNTVARMAGASRFETAASVSQFQWATAGDESDQRQPAKSVVLARSDTFADALGGAALAARKVGPLLLTKPASLDPTTADEIDRVLDPGATVYLLGGTSALSPTVANHLTSRGYTTVRLAGANRYETSVAIANAIDPTPDLVLVATGTNFPDALAAGAAAGSFDTPGTGLSAVVVLTANSVLPTATKNYLNKWTTNTGDAPWAIGGQAATALAPHYARYELIGKNRYETALLVAHYFFGGEGYAGVATGTNWPDALAGGALMATVNGPLLLTPSNDTTLNMYTNYFLNKDSGSISVGLVFGGTGAVNDALDDKIGANISGPAGFDIVDGAALSSSRSSALADPANTAASTASDSADKGSVLEGLTRVKPLPAQ